MGLKEIAAASEQITDGQILPKHSDVLVDSPPTKKYESSSRKLYELLRLRILIICILPYLTPFFSSLRPSAEADYIQSIAQEIVHSKPWSFDTLSKR